MPARSVPVTASDDSNARPPSDPDEDAQLRRRVIELEGRLDRLQGEYDRVTSSASFRILRRLHGAVDRLAPWGTRRRSVVLVPGRMLRAVRRRGLGPVLRGVLTSGKWSRIWAPAIPPLDRLSPEERYNLWVKLVMLAPRRLRAMRRAVRRFDYRPRISVVLPVHDPEPAWLRDALDSVRSQIYPNWQLCIVDDGSSRQDVKGVLQEARADPRIDVVTLDGSMGISAASNAGLERAQGDFVGFLDHDDALKPTALFEVVRLLNARRDLDYVYSDEDKAEPGGWLTDPFFKPGWSPDLLLSVNYVTHFSVYRTEIVRAVGGFRAEFDGSQDYDLVLRVTEVTDQVAHVPMPLYSWRKVPGSAAAHLAYKPHAYDAGTRALEDALRRRGVRGSVEPGLVGGRYRVRYSIEGEPRVVVIVPTRDRLDLLRTCLESVVTRSTYRNHVVFVVDNDSREPDTLAYLDSTPHRVLRHPGPFHYSRMMNAAVEEAGEADFVLFLNNDTEVIAPDWIEAMLEHGQRPGVAAVGARLLFRSGDPQHEGIVVGLGGSPARNVVHDYFDLGRTIRNCSAVTAACMLIRSEVLRELGGFEERLEVAWGDVDLCLRAREKGYEVVYTPHALLYHEEGSTRGRGGLHGPHDDALFLSRWGDYRDPYYNPNLDTDRSFELSMNLADAH
jgi:O-antigen biosynthesis protein